MNINQLPAIFLKIRRPINPKEVKNPARIPPSPIPFALPNFSLGSGNIGWSMT